ncbi:MerR family transcriptional regulator [Nocardia colli]|uniref:MerR family transcriptional regulator n=1 Tax=Nocardia colli TaxID=2545717 RepID=A0A5N0EB57_9NOCA|nr:MerR family transcriptional regulator [Nocardia colli]KAA8884731.1 MerR family transcriptional regulator [Nocardia colli]
MKSSDAVTGIGAAAARFGLATHVLRHWESVGLLTPQRDSAGRRRYREDDIFRVAVIQRAKEAGFTLDDIHTMLTTPDRSAVLTRQRDELQARIATAQASLDLIEHALACDHADFTTCPHFQAAVSERLFRQ